MSTRWTRSAISGVAGAAVAVLGVYAAVTAIAWYRYGRIPEPDPTERDELLDRFMPDYEVVERHHTYVAAPPWVTLTAAREQHLLEIPLVRLIIRTRELAMGASGGDPAQPKGLLAAVQSLGWGVLADVPDRELVMGAVTRPWEPNVTFRALPPDAFTSFNEPGFVKIAWTLRADSVDTGASIFRTETRAMATDAAARARFRRYWAFTSPGIALIRRLSLTPLRRDAERRYAALALS